MSRDETLLESLAAAVADGSSVDWSVAEGAARHGIDLELVRQFRRMASIGAATRATATRSASRWSRAADVGYDCVVALAALKLLPALLAAGGAIWAGSLPAQRWLFTANVLLYAGAGAVLLVGATRDARLRSLGAFFIIIASAFANPLIPAAGARAWNGLIPVLRALPADAFLALAFWQFVWRFPETPKAYGIRQTGKAFLVASAAVGMTLFIVNAVGNLTAVATSWPLLAPVVRALDRSNPMRVYWPLLFGLAAAAVPYLAWKSRLTLVQHRHRATFFLAALVAGLSPMLVAVIATPIVPALQEPRWRLTVSILLYTMLASVVPSTLYAVAVDRVMDIHLVLRKALQHRIARDAFWIVSLGPVTYLLFDIYRHRELTMTQYFELPLPLALLGSSLVGFTALTFHHQLLRIVDRWFFRETVDYVEALSRLERGLRGTRSVQEIAAVVAREIDSALHPTAVAVLVADEHGKQFVTVDGALPPLDRHALLVELIRSTPAATGLDVSPEGPIVRVLPARDREWLLETDLRLLSPLLGTTGILFGVVGVGEARNGLPYIARDRTLVTTMSSQAAFQVENQWLRDRSIDEPQATLIDAVPSVKWQNEPAAYCPGCLTVLPPETKHCSCGAATKTAALPLLVKGKFRIERMLGSGGMGIVYLAVDIVLNRKVAVKTLPTLTVKHARRLQREARAMASVLHPNLALIYGFEEWRGTPLLVVEYLEGGTLMDSLRLGRLDVAGVIDLGVVLADVLDRLHASGVLHRDIKPSNIGFTASGVPKLLDFGLASILDRSMDATDPDLEPRPLEVADRLAQELLEPARSQSSLTFTNHLIGTPLYLSPEAVAGQPPQPSFDHWSLCVLLYEAIAGRHPLSGYPIGDILHRIQYQPLPAIGDLQPECPAPVAAFLTDALSLEPARRPATAGELRNRLQRLRATLGSGRERRKSPR
jgi:hypothetical protein